MTTRTTFERDLPAILEDLYLGPTPDYRDEVLATATHTPQRPSWTFAGRWLPMADIASRPALAPRVPWRAVGLALLLIALLLVTAFVVGSRQTRLPPPFGLANNGLVVYAADGDIHIYDPATGEDRPFITGPETDGNPMFSYDGTRIGWTRDTRTDGGSPARLILVADADGSDVTIVTPELIGSEEAFEWVPDARGVIVERRDGLWLYSVDPSSPPRQLITDAVGFHKPFRPPAADQILARREVDDDVQILLVDLDTLDEVVLAEVAAVGQARWSPDGSQVVYSAPPADDPESERLFIVNADGTGTRQITNAPGTWFDIDATWSPDGTRIAFTRYERVAPDDWQIRPTGVYTIADGEVTSVGPLPREIRARYPTERDSFASAGEGFFLEWSPDASTLFAFHSEAPGHMVAIDAATGAWEAWDPVTAAGVPIHAWQRTAP